MSTPVHLHVPGPRPGGLSGHDLMSLFPPSQSTPSQPTSPFGREEREYLSSRRGELPRPRMRATPTGYDDSSSSSGSSSESSTHYASASPHSNSSRAPRAQRPPATKTVTPAPSPAPRRTATNYQTQVHLDQGSGDSQFLVMRMSLASMSNTTPDCHFSEFRATQYPSRNPGKPKRP